MLERFPGIKVLSFLTAGLLLIPVLGDVGSGPVQAAGPQQAPPPAAASPAAANRALLDKYCVTCHNQRLRTADLTLDTMDVDHIGAGAEVWEKVLVKLRSGAMPPVSRPRPDAATMKAFTGWLETELDHAAELNPVPGRVAIHRLNRTEYVNAVRDLLSLEVDSKSVLIDEDPGESGFDNTAGALSVSPLLVERYLSAARKVSRMAIGDPAVTPGFDTYTISKTLVQDERMGEDLPFASHGGAAIRHRFLVDGEYVVKVRLAGNVYGFLFGLGRQHVLEVRLDGERITQLKIGGEAPGRPSALTYAGDIPGDDKWELYMHNADTALEVRFPAKAGTHVLNVSFAEHTPEPEGVVQPLQTGASGIEYNQFYDGNPQIRTIAIGGPYQITGPGETPSRERVFVCRPKAEADEADALGCARKIVTTLARRAYRRPVTDKDVEPVLAFYNTGRKQGGFDAGIEAALTRILVDPEFLVRIEKDPPKSTAGTVYRLDDVSLASRLSFFLWSSIPDDELLDAAARGKLQDPRVLSQQVKRLSADPRSKTVIDNFASQWLSLPKLRGVTPDPDLFPDFDDNLRAAFGEETKLFLESQIREDHSVVDLLSANYTFANERLARFYGIPNVYGDSFRRVTFDNGQRGGLLGQGSILTVTSYANRTSPVFRGKWVLENLLAAPPPQPPPNVPALKESTPSKPLSVRERLEEHRKNPVCAGCHARMDPIGFAFENFDATGAWRTQNEDRTAVDASGTLPDGTTLNGVAGLRQYLLDRREQFVGAVTEKLLAYALGRGIEYYDLPAVRKITRAAAANDYRWSSIIEGVVKSVPFQMSIVRNSQSAANGASGVPKVALK